MSIHDNGKSFSMERLLAKGSKRLGLPGMRERLEMAGGRFEIASAAGQGTTVTAEMPFGKDETKVELYPWRSFPSARKVRQAGSLDATVQTARGTK